MQAFPHQVVVGGRAKGDILAGSPLLLPFPILCLAPPLYNYGFYALFAIGLHGGVFFHQLVELELECCFRGSRAMAQVGVERDKVNLISNKEQLPCFWEEGSIRICLSILQPRLGAAF